MKQLKPTHKTKAGILAEVYEFDPYAIPDWFAKEVEQGRAAIFQDNEERWSAKFGNKRGQYVAFLGDYILKDEFGHIFVVSQRTFANRYERLGLK